jgi:transposase
MRLGDEAVKRGNFSSVATDYGVSYSTVARAHQDLATLVAEAAIEQAPRAVTLDETRFRAGHDYITIVSDVERSRPVDVIKGRHDRDLERWFRSRDPQWLLGIQVVACDLWPPFLRAAARWLPHAAVVADRFHVMRSFVVALDRMRKRIQGRARSRGPRSHIYAVRGALLADPRSLDLNQGLKLHAVLASEPELAVGHGLVRLLRAVYDCRDRASAERAMQVLIDTAEACDVPEFRSALASIVRHRHEILNYFDHFVTSALAEGTNTKTKLIKRQAYGMRNFGNFRERIMLACGRPKPGKPRLIA